MHKYQKSCSLLILPFHGLLHPVWAKVLENSYSRQFSAQVSQLVFLADLTVFRLLEHKIVFLADLTVSRLITAVWAEMSESSHLSEVSVKVWQIVLLADLTVLPSIITVWPKMSEDSYFQ